MDSPSTTDTPAQSNSGRVQITIDKEYNSFEEVMTDYNKLYNYILERDPAVAATMRPPEKPTPIIYTAKNGTHYTMTDVSTPGCRMYKMDIVDADGNPLRK